ncbi:hypothetical protein CLAFUW4_01051 [Fulvia fulva]|nr:hypothetical protein CLAFUR4_01052 [Fulvia fulva]WPV09463.1 hypothetical protein CLAFUW4_01051 [Fulvia fulva]WPV23443.1 hypothetical protein CLAFUW7_01056 [Fulvia fulva]
MPLSSTPVLRIAASVLGTIFIAFGANAILNPASALSFFELAYPDGVLQKDAKLAVDALSIVYGVRDVLMGIAIYAAAYFGTRPALGWILIAAGGVAGVDGYVCKSLVGSGEMNHWGYGPIVAVLGLVSVAGL